MPLVRLYPIVLALLIASCGRPAAVTQSQTETPPTTAFDGSYQSAIRVIHRVRSDQSEGFVATTARATVSSQRPTASWADRAAARAVSLQEIDRL